MKARRMHGEQEVRNMRKTEINNRGEKKETPHLSHEAHQRETLCRGGMAMASDDLNLMSER